MNTYGCCGGNSGYLSGYTINDTVSYYLKAYSGDYIQTLPNGAPEATFTFWFDVFADLKPLDKGQKLRVFPNPASSFVMVDGNIGDLQFANYQILNLSGMVVSEGDLKGSPKIGLPENLASGVYILKIITSGKSWVSTLYLQR
jgi:hypothetical protein